MSEIRNSNAAPPTTQSQAQQLTQQSSQQQGEQRRAGDAELTRASANRLSGLASGLNPQETIDKIMQVERRRLRPVENEKAQTLRELQSFAIVDEQLGKIEGTVQKLAGSNVWEGKLVESSNEDAVTATATAGAKPGKHTLVVEKLALNHQLASQGFESQDTQIGTGKFNVTVGEGSPISVVVDETNNTLAGLKDAINFATDEVDATIIKTGSSKAPYQLVLTSQKTGTDGRLTIEVDLEGGAAPNFSSSVEEPSAWQGVGEEKAAERAGRQPGGAGASTAIAQVVGEYTGEDDNTFTFTAVQSGQVGESDQLQLRWEDEQGRSGTVQLGKFNYAVGEPVEVTDGMALVFSEGDVVVGDSFQVSARAERSDRYWWVSPENRQAAFSRPTAWSRQATQGAPMVEGTYTGDVEQAFTLTIQGSGQVGGAQDLRLLWRGSERGQGELNIGQGYTPGTPLALTDGITVSLNQGVLVDGQEATFDVTPRELSGQWWLPESEREIPASIGEPTNWSGVGEEEGQVARMPELPEEAGPRVSNAPVQVAGEFNGDESKVYTFTALRDGTVGTTKDLKLRWEDDKGHSGELTIGEQYRPGTPLPFDAGLALALGAGRVFENDSFTLRTRTATVQPPQDALIRFGATELGGGLEITNSTNELDDVIDGVRLSLVSTSDKPVTITVRGDTEKASELVGTFVQEFNTLAAIVNELTKYDKEKDIAGPLLGNREVTDIRTRLSDQIINPVAGLPDNANMLITLGIKFNDKGLLELDESKLQQRVQEDFAQVADLFRNRGETDNSQVAFAGMSPDTRVSTDGYPVDITQPATQGSYTTPPLTEPIVLDEGNRRFTVTVDGRQSETLELPARRYSVAEYARALQDAITNDKRVGDRRVRVMTEGNRIKVISGRFGSSSNINFAPLSGGTGAGQGLLTGETEAGKDVAGTINGLVAEGTGQLLKLPEDSGPASGLRTFVKLNAEQLDPNGPEATITVTRGVASRMASYLDTVINPINGRMRRITQNLRDRIGNLDDQLQRMKERIDNKREQLQEKFSRLESQMSQLKSQQNYLSGQLSSLPSPGGGAAAALPGMPGL